MLSIASLSRRLPLGNAVSERKPVIHRRASLRIGCEIFSRSLDQTGLEEAEQAKNILLHPLGRAYPAWKTETGYGPSGGPRVTAHTERGRETEEIADQPLLRCRIPGFHQAFDSEAALNDCQRTGANRVRRPRLFEARCCHYDRDGTSAVPRTTADAQISDRS